MTRRGRGAHTDRLVLCAFAAAAGLVEFDALASGNGHYMLRVPGAPWRSVGGRQLYGYLLAVLDVTGAREGPYGRSLCQLLDVVAPAGAEPLDSGPDDGERVERAEVARALYARGLIADPRGRGGPPARSGPGPVDGPGGGGAGVEVVTAHDRFGGE